MHTLRSILCTAEIGNDAMNKAAEHGIVLDVLPFIDVTYVEDTDVLDRVNKLAEVTANIVFTSRNAVISVAALLKGKQVNWRICCLGNKTKIAVRQLLNIECECTTGSSIQLAQHIIDTGIKQVTFCCTDIRIDTLPDALNAAGVTVDELIVYRTIETPHKLTKHYDGVLFFSPSGVRSFFSTNSINDETALFAIGQTTAGQIKEYTDMGVILSTSQSKEGMIETAINFFKDKTIVA